MLKLVILKSTRLYQFKTFIGKKKKNHKSQRQMTNWKNISNKWDSQYTVLLQYKGLKFTIHTQKKTLTNQ